MIVCKVRRRSSDVFFNLGRHGQVPSKHAIKTWIKNFEETGSALKRNRQDDREVLVLHRISKLYAFQSYGAHSVQFVR